MGVCIIIAIFAIASPIGTVRQSGPRCYVRFGARFPREMRPSRSDGLFTTEVEPDCNRRRHGSDSKARIQPANTPPYRRLPLVEIGNAGVCGGAVGCVAGGIVGQLKPPVPPCPPVVVLGEPFVAGHPLAAAWPAAFTAA
jgi:hypothetical protein